jgi:hypothetical protein
MATTKIKKTDGTQTIFGANHKVVGNIAAAKSAAVGAPSLIAPPVVTDTMLGDLKGEDRLAAAEDQLVAAVEGMKNSADFMLALDFASKLHGYSFWNSLFLMAEHSRRRDLDPSTPADPGSFASFNKWKELGRTVKKGAKGYPVFVPVTASGSYYEVNGQKVFLKKGEKPPVGVDVKRSSGAVVGFRVGSTFPEFLTEGEPIPKAPSPVFLEGEGVVGLTESSTKFAESLGFTVEYVNPAELRGANGTMNPSSKTIRVRNDVDHRQQQKTLIHEVAHAVMHSGEGYDYAGCRGMAEVQAEATAYMVTKMLAPDADTSDYSVPYIAGWSNGMKTTEMRQVINSVGKAANQIVDSFNGFKAEQETVDA